MKVVLDTNIFISGIFWDGASNEVVLAWKERKFILVSSLEIISELTRVLKDFTIKLPDDAIKEWEELITKNSEIVSIENTLAVIKEDLSDNKFLETALSGNAGYIISQDQHLLKLREFRNIKIITPAEFLKIFNIT